jgi:D-alanyl-D-alanine carboxypeptidase (penicillin-binding protein 5/6)
MALVPLLAWTLPAAAAGPPPTAPSASFCGVPAPRSAAPPAVDAEAYEVMDARTGRVLAAMRPNLEVQPASLTKLATLDLALAALQRGRATLAARVPIGPAVRALAMEPGITLMGLGLAGPTVSLRAVLLGMTLRSGNDAAVALAAYLGGSVHAFVRQMNALAQRLGMRGTHFGNPDGLPAPGQWTTAADMAILARHILLHHPDFTAFTGRQQLDWHGLTLTNLLDPLLACDPRVVGAKGGWLPQSGYHLVAAARQGGHTLIVAVMGSATFPGNVAAVEALLDWGFVNLASARPPAGFPGVAADTSRPMPAFVRAALPGPAPGDLSLAFGGGGQGVLRAGRLQRLPGVLPPGVPLPRWIPGTGWLLVGQRAGGAGVRYALVPGSAGRAVPLPACASRSGVQQLPRAVAWFCGDRLLMAPVGTAGLGPSVTASAYALPAPPPIPGGFVVNPGRTLVAVRRPHAVVVVDLRDGRRLATLAAPPPGVGVRLAWSSGDVLAVAAGQRLTLWSPSRAGTAATLDLGPGTISVLGWQPSGDAVLTLVVAPQPGGQPLERVVRVTPAGQETTLADGPMGDVLTIDPGAGLLWREEGVSARVAQGHPGDGPFTLWAVRLGRGIGSRRP